MSNALALATLDTFLNRIFCGEASTLARSLPANSIDCVVTSPPYYGLRDYGHADQIGLEDSPQVYIERLVELFDLIHKALKPSGTVWLNLGDSYSGNGKTGRNDANRIFDDGIKLRPFGKGGHIKKLKQEIALPPKNLMMIPARVAIALQERGWVLRSEIIWHKPAPMPESVKDRPTKAHEIIYLLTKSARYWYSHKSYAQKARHRGLVTSFGNKAAHNRTTGNMAVGATYKTGDVCNLRDVWTIPFEPSRNSHYASYPTEIPRRCILLGCPPNGVVYDPFMGSGTTAAVAQELRRQWVGSELNSDYVELINQRVATTQIAMFTELAA